VRPLDYGADILATSATNTSAGTARFGGIIVDGGKFKWNNGKFPEYLRTWTQLSMDWFTGMFLRLCRNGERCLHFFRSPGYSG